MVGVVPCGAYSVRVGTASFRWRFSRRRMRPRLALLGMPRRALVASVLHDRTAGRVARRIDACRLARTAMLTRAGIARPPHVLRFRFGLWKRKVQLHVAIEWFKLVVRAQRHLVQAISRWRTVAAASMRLHGAVIAWEHTAEIRHARRPRPVRCQRQLSGGWAAWRMRQQEAARQRERSRRALLHHEVHRVRRQQARGWRAWLARQAEAGRCRALLRRGMAVGARGAARRALRGWAESAQRLWLAAAERRRSEQAAQQQAGQPGLLHEPEWLRLAAAALLLPARATPPHAPPHTPPHTPPCGARVEAVEASGALDALAASDADAPAPALAPARGAAGGGGGGEAGDHDAPQWLLQAEATLASSATAATAAADTDAASPLAAAERAALQQSLWWWARCTANLAMARAGRAVAHWLAKRGALRQMRRRAGWPERLTPLGRLRNSKHSFL